jgi:hypothetical protein
MLKERRTAGGAHRSVECQLEAPVVAPRGGAVRLVRHRSVGGGTRVGRPALKLAQGSYWIVDDTGFPKKGRHSVGVARQYCGQLGKQDNCQVAVSLSLASAQGSVPIAWWLHLSVRPAGRNRVGGGLTTAALPQHRTYGSRIRRFLNTAAEGATATCVSFVVSPAGR